MNDTFFFRTCAETGLGAVVAQQIAELSSVKSELLAKLQASETRLEAKLQATDTRLEATELELAERPEPSPNRGDGGNFKIFRIILCLLTSSAAPSLLV